MNQTDPMRPVAINVRSIPFALRQRFKRLCVKFDKPMEQRIIELIQLDLQEAPTFEEPELSLVQQG